MAFHLPGLILAVSGALRPMVAKQFNSLSLTSRKLRRELADGERHAVAPPSVAHRVLGELAIATRRDPQQPDERAPHYVDAAESSCRGRVLEAYILTFELATRRLHAHLKHVL